MIDVKNLFVRFLKECNCYDKFKVAYKNGHKFRCFRFLTHYSDINLSDATLIDYLKSTEETWFINYAFKWEKTKDGRDFWLGIHERWVEILKCKNYNSSDVMKKVTENGEWKSVWMK